MSARHELGPQPGRARPGTHELPTHLDAANKPFLGVTLPQFFALVGAVAGGVILAGHLPTTIALPARLAVGAVLCALLAALALLRPAGKTLWEWAGLLRAYAGQARVTVWTRTESE